MKAIKTAEFDFRRGVPRAVRETIDAQLAINTEDAKSAGQLGFMARAMVLATMPYKDPKTDVYERRNGNFKLRILAGYEGGIPFGIYPRLLMSWVATEAVRKQSPKIELGESLRVFLTEILDIRSDSGGRRGAGNRVVEQMKRLFGSLITASGVREGREFILRNVLIADELTIKKDSGAEFWTPQTADEAGKWQSTVTLSHAFFEECVTSPVPIDLRAYKGLRGSPLAMDIYTWLTYRLSYTHKPTHPIPWESLMMQFGSDFTGEYAAKNFKTGFLKALRLVTTVYPDAKIKPEDNGIILFPSRPHILPAQQQKQLSIF